MSIEIKVPSLGESVVEATVAKWYKNVGDSVTIDEPLLELETDKVTLEVPSPCSGQLDKISSNEDEIVKVGAILGVISEKNISREDSVSKENKEQSEPSKIIKESIEVKKENQENPIATKPPHIAKIEKLSPSVRKAVAEKNIDPETISISRADGRITKSDLINYENNLIKEDSKNHISNESLEKRVPMSRLRQTIAKRLKDAQNNAAILTTFNEVDMHELIETRNELKESFELK